MMNVMRLLLVIFVALAIGQAQAAINPLYKECLQRGYTVAGDSCVFPDGSACLLEEFNNLECGQEFFEVHYCVPEGEPVWDAPCCAGLQPYLPDGVAGQATCQPRQYVIISRLKSSWMLWGLLITVLIAVLVAVRRKGKRNR